MLRFLISRLTLAAGVSLAAAQAKAETSVDVPEQCGSREEFEAELARLLGSEASKLSPYTLTIAASESGADYLLRMTLHGEQRELRDTDCRTLFKSAVVVAAASVRPELLVELPKTTQPAPDVAPAAPPAPAPPPAPVARDEGQRPAPPVAPPPEPTPWRGGVALGAGVVVGLVPDVAPLFELAGLAERRGFGAVLALRHATLSDTEAESGRGVEVRAFGGRAGVSYSPVEFLRMSAGLEADLMVGRGTGVTTPLSDEAWSVALGAELAAILMNVDGLRLEVALQGRWALLRPSFQIEGYGEAYRVPRFGGAGLFRAAYLLF